MKKQRLMRPKKSAQKRYMAGETHHHILSDIFWGHQLTGFWYITVHECRRCKDLSFALRGRINYTAVTFSKILQRKKNLLSK